MSATFEALSGLGVPVHDYEEMTYTLDGKVETITYKRGGASGVTVATTTITYNLDGTVASLART